MHYFVGVIIPKHIDKADKEYIADMMEPYSSEYKTELYKNYLEKWAVETLCENNKIENLDTNNPMAVAKIIMDIPEWYGEDKGAGIDEDGFYCWSTRNLNARWDWYSIGGRWNGLIKNKSRDDKDNGFNFGEEFNNVEENWSDFDDYVNLYKEGKDVKCFAYLTPDGMWNKGEDFDSISVEDTEKIFAEYKGKGFDIIGVDCHN